MTDKWPEIGDHILVQDAMSDTLRISRSNAQPPTGRGVVIRIPPDGGGHLELDAGGEWGVIAYAAFGFDTRYTWKPDTTKAVE